jgi:hypothetical protein
LRASKHTEKFCPGPAVVVLQQRRQATDLEQLTVESDFMALHLVDGGRQILQQREFRLRNILQFGEVCVAGEAKSTGWLARGLARSQLALVSLFRLLLAGFVAV